MITKKKAQDLYAGKYFYEIVKPKTVGGIVQLFGPYDNIYYAKALKTDKCKKPEVAYKFVQVIDGLPVQAFREDEILVTDRKL